MNIDKVKVTRYVSLILCCLGILNRILGHYGYGLPDSELNFWSDIISIVASVVFGVTIEANTIKALFSGKSGSL
ncbi:hypothetical protein [Paenibacillus anseongense]|uniref:hypothetical protein n=1 Tax=Paenibacillus anseongense TaxID=2682845 RepID=UPI002DBD980E|nr:hypothetical protein [Paenibacillus anseongense]MEC0265122.1 hypothetical protein [Paenibacillus anseongense]